MPSFLNLYMSKSSRYVLMLECLEVRIYSERHTTLDLKSTNILEPGLDQ